MKLTITLIFLTFSCLAQDRYLKESDIENAHIKKGIVLYDTLEKGQGGAFRFILTDFGTVDTTKLIIVKYEAFQIDAGTVPVAQVDTVDGEQLGYTNWQKPSIGNPGTTSSPGWYKRTISYSVTGEASYKFTGSRVEIYGEKLSTHGQGLVTVGSISKTAFWNGTDQNNNGVIETSERVTSKVLPALIFNSGQMPRDEYTLLIKPTAGVILIDYIVVHK